MHIRIICAILLAFAVFATDGVRANWPHWRGPLASGFAPNADPPLKWDEKTNLKWKVKLPGKGSSTPIVWGDKIFVTTAEDTGRKARPHDIPKPDPKYDVKTKPPETYYRFLVLCFDRNTGKRLWQKTAVEEVPHEGTHPTHSYAAGSPTTDGKRLYASFGSRGVYCYDLDGKLLWQKRLGVMHTRYGWGEASTPVVHDDTLIVNWDHEGQSFIFALNAKTGDIRWNKKRDEPTSWATPAIVTRNGKTQVVVNGTNRVRSYDLKTGEVIWQCGGQTVNAIPSPIVHGAFAYCMSGYRGSTAQALPLESQGDITGTKKIAWKISKGTPYVPSPLLMGDRLFFTASNSPVLNCVDYKTGKVIYQQRLSALGGLYASPVGAKDRIYITDRDGVTLVIQAGDEFKVLAENRLNDPIDASPAVVGRQMFLRGHRYLYCVEKK